MKYHKKFIRFFKPESDAHNPPSPQKKINKILKKISTFKPVHWMLSFRSNKAHSVEQTNIQAADKISLFSLSEIKENILARKYSQEEVNEIVKKCHAQLQHWYARFEKIQQSLKQQFHGWLNDTDNQLKNTEKTQPDFSKLSTQQPRQKSIELLWNFIQSTQNPDELAQNTLGLMGVLPIREILIGINRLYPHLNAYQQGLAQYMVFNLLKNDPHTMQETAASQFERFLRRCAKEPAPLYAVNLQDLQRANHTYTALNKNFLELQALVNQNNKTEQHPQPSKDNLVSFEALVDSALAKSSKNRQVEVTLIAHELMNMTKCFYQRISIEELCLRKDEQKENVKNFVKYFNIINNFLVKKILKQPTEKIESAVLLLAQIADVLYSLKSEQSFADLSGLLLMASALNNSSVSRLILNPDQPLLRKLQNICSPANNHAGFTELSHSVEYAFPNIPLTQKSLTFAKDGNPNLLDRVLVMGSILKAVQEASDRVKNQAAEFATDLPSFVQRYKPLTDDALYEASLAHRPRSGNLSPRVSSTSLKNKVPLLRPSHSLSSMFGRHSSVSSANDPKPPISARL